MFSQKVIFDNTVLNYAVRLKTVDLIRLSKEIFTENVLIPAAVFNEFENLQAEFYPIDKLRIEYIKRTIRKNTFFKFCSDFDTIVHDRLIRTVDHGEADAIAQSERTNVRFFITDDQAATFIIKQDYQNIKTFSTFFLICIADVMKLLPDYNKAFSEFHDLIEYSKFNATTRKAHKAKLRNEYTQALKLTGKYSDKKIISAKTSVDTILKGS